MQDIMGYITLAIFLASIIIPGLVGQRLFKRSGIAEDRIISNSLMMSGYGLVVAVATFMLIGLFSLPKWSAIFLVPITEVLFFYWLINRGEKIETIKTPSTTGVVAEVTSGTADEENTGVQSIQINPDNPSPAGLFRNACELQATDQLSEAKTLFNQLVDDFPHTEESHKAKLRLMKINQPANRSVPVWIAIIPLFLLANTGSKQSNVDVIFFFMFVIYGSMFIYQARIAWKDFALDNAETIFNGAVYWLWFIAIVNIVAGLLIKFTGVSSDVLSTDWSGYLLFGIGYLILAAITSYTKNGLTLLAIILAIAAWGGDTIYIASEILAYGFALNPAIYVMLAFHLYILSHMLKGLSGLSGIFKARTAHSLDSDDVAEYETIFSIMSDRELFDVKPYNLSSTERRLYELEVAKRKALHT